jgi:serine/threonine-protein kinase
MTYPSPQAMPASAPWLGRVLDGKYRIEEVLAEGGMGIIFRGTQLQLDRPVAIKVLRPDVPASTETVARFEREARLVAMIASEHVVRVHDVGNQPGVGPYMVMELLEGHDLGEIAGVRQVPIGEAVTYVLHACDALREVHARGIVHRDLKPANLFLAIRTQNAPILKVVDFGISNPEARRAPGRGDGVIGTPAYMSPEQLTGGSVDARADIWSLGVVLYELLTGALPFAGETRDVVEGVVRRVPAPVRATRPDVPEALSALLARCLAKDPAHRFPDVTTLAAALAAFATPTPSVPAFAAAAPSSARIALPAPVADLRLAPTVIVRKKKPRSAAALGLGLAAVVLAVLAAAIAAVAFVTTRR